jgi:hypothetical protein
MKRKKIEIRLTEAALASSTKLGGSRYSSYAMTATTSRLLQSSASGRTKHKRMEKSLKKKRKSWGKKRWDGGFN